MKFTFWLAVALSVSLVAATAYTRSTAAFPSPAVRTRGLPAISAVKEADAKGTLLQFDFNGGNAWPEATASRGAKVEPRLVGTIDVVGSTEASGGMLLTFRGSGANTSAFVQSGLLPLRNTELDTAKLTLSFTLSVNILRPVILRIESFDAGKRRTGGLETRIYPAAPGFPQRFAIDLSTMKSFDGGFQPTAPFVSLSFGVDGGADGQETQIRLDNVHYAKPAMSVPPAATVMMGAPKIPPSRPPRRRLMSPDRATLFS
jgi:hypothetical protein